MLKRSIPEAFSFYTEDFPTVRSMLLKGDLADLETALLNRYAQRTSTHHPFQRARMQRQTHNSLLGSL